jgi:RNA polymerase sigma factor (sigma-70 family)
VDEAQDSKAESSFDVLSDAFVRYRKAIARAVVRIVRPGDVEDIMQETYLRIYQTVQREPIRHPRSLMLRAARNLALNHVARADALNYVQESEDLEPDSDESATLDPAGLAESAEIRAQAEEEFLVFCRAIRELPVQCRRAFILKKVYGLSQREVAERLGIAEATVEKHIAKGIAACSSYMAAQGYARPALAKRAGALPRGRAK